MKVDWNKVRKEYKKLGCPKDVYNPCKIPFEGNSWFFLCSERSIGKTTNVLLIGLILHKLYGIQVQYIRDNADMLAPKNLNNLCAVIANHGYIEKLTDGQYNTITYHARKWCYGYWDSDTGKILSKSDPVISCLAISENAIYKSSYNAPTGDFIIFDECISRYYYHNEFVDFCDLTCTIGRFREGVKIVLLSNTIDPYAPIIDEIEAQHIVETMNIGDHEEYYTSGGTPTYIELCGNLDTKRVELSRLFYGFKNPRLKSITGGGWAMNNYPHPVIDNYEILHRGHFIQCANNILVQLDLCSSDEFGNFVIVHKATKTIETDVIWTIGDIKKRTERFKFGYTPLDKYLLLLRQQNKWYYASNMVGTLVSTYFRQASTINDKL